MHEDGWPIRWCHSCKGALTMTQAYGGEEKVMPNGHIHIILTKAFK